LQAREEATMPKWVRAAVAAGVFAVLPILAGAPAAAGGDENPDGYGLYSPLRRGTYRYDPRSWYYRQPGYYPYYATNYWVPRAHMRYRYRYTYYGPKYRYYPAWGYPLWGREDISCCRWHW
jgi:hypothetical protein